MARLLTLPVTTAQRALARFHNEEDAFRTVLDALAQWRQNGLVLGVFTVYRARLRMLRRLAGGLLDGIEEPSATEELRRITPPLQRFTPRLRPIPRKRDR
jgi:hypothetical protein